MILHDIEEPLWFLFVRHPIIAYLHSPGPSPQDTFGDFGVVALAGVGVLLAWDCFPHFVPARSHDFLGAFTLAMIALAYLVYQCARRPARMELVKAILLAVAFFSGQPINCCLIIVKLRSLTTLPLTFCFRCVFGHDRLAKNFARRVLC
jgi:hypothetical protein